MRLFIGLVFLTALQAQQPPASMVPKHYASGQYRIVKDGATTRLFLGNSTTPITLTMTAPNMYVSNAGVIYNEVPGSGLFETSMGVDPKVFSPEAVAAAEEKRQRDSNPPFVPEPVKPVLPEAVSLSRNYPVHDFGPAPLFMSNISAVIDFNGTQIPVWGYNEKAGLSPTEINGHPQWYRSQSGVARTNTTGPDTGIYVVKEDADGWRVEKYTDRYPPELILLLIKK